MPQLVMVKPGIKKFSGSDFAIGLGIGFVVGAIIFTAVGRELAKETYRATSKAISRGSRSLAERLREYAESEE